MGPAGGGALVSPRRAPAPGPLLPSKRSAPLEKHGLGTIKESMASAEANLLQVGLTQLSIAPSQQYATDFNELKRNITAAHFGGHFGHQGEEMGGRPGERGGFDEHVAQQVDDPLRGLSVLRPEQEVCRARQDEAVSRRFRGFRHGLPGGNAWLLYGGTAHRLHPVQPDRRDRGGMPPHRRHLEGLCARTGGPRLHPRLHGFCVQGHRRGRGLPHVRRRQAEARLCWCPVVEVGCVWFLEPCCRRLPDLRRRLQRWRP